MISQRIYKMLLWLYPLSFRSEYGPQMTQFFADRLRDASRRGTLGILWLWLHTLNDLIPSAIQEYSDMFKQSTFVKTRYFDGMAAQFFKTTDVGTLLFYPWGYLGRGYILPDQNKKYEIQMRLTRFHMWAMVIGLTLITLIPLAFVVMIMSATRQDISSWPVPHLNGWLIGSVVWLVILVVGFLAQWSFLSRLVEGLEPASTRLSLLESYRNAAESFGLRTLLLLGLVNIAGWLLTAERAISWNHGPMATVGLVILVLIFGLSSLATGYMIKVKLE